MSLVYRTTSLVLSLAVLPLVAKAAPLNDTGVDRFSDGNSFQTNEPANFPGQDPRFGRDAAAKSGVLPKTGSGAKGFDFTKIANNGSELPANAALGPNPGDWACTRDNVTGYLWEIKADDNGLRDKDHRYSWFSSDNSSNGGNQGTANGGTCFDELNCDTEKYAAAVNAATLCGFDDWQLPTRE